MRNFAPRKGKPLRMVLDTLISHGEPVTLEEMIDLCGNLYGPHKSDTKNAVGAWVSSGWMKFNDGRYSVSAAAEKLIRADELKGAETEEYTGEIVPPRTPTPFRPLRIDAVDYEAIRAGSTDMLRHPSRMTSEATQ